MLKYWSRAKEKLLCYAKTQRGRILPKPFSWRPEQHKLPPLCQQVEGVAAEGRFSLASNQQPGPSFSNTRLMTQKINVMTQENK